MLYTNSKKYATTEKELLALVMTVEHYHPYLYGKKFIIYTDHAPLTFLPNKPNPHMRVERWMMRLSMYDYVIKYKPGKENFIADLLSRPTEIEENNAAEDEYLDQLIANVELENFQIIDLDSNVNILQIASEPSSEKVNEYHSYIDEQKKDIDIQWIKDIISKHGDKKPVIKTFENKIRRTLFKEYYKIRIVEDIVYRVYEDSNGYMATQFIIPKQIIREVIKQVHSSVYNAHLGKKKTEIKLFERMYHPELKEEIDNFIKTCDICQKIKREQVKSVAEMFYLSPSKPNQIVTTDLAGPLKKLPEKISILL